MNTIIQVNRLTKNYGASRGITDVSFEIHEGEVFGFLGPNGAGKTTTMRVLMGLLRPTAGKATIGGLDCWSRAPEVKRLIGSLIERLGLDPSKRFREYSRGNKQKVGLVQAFMHKPRLLILDEPTTGLDPLNQQEFYNMIAEVHAEGRTVFLSSHILPEVEHTCSRVGIIREGRLIQVSEVTALKDIRQHEVEMSFATPASPAWFKNVPGILTASPGHDGLDIHLTVQGDLREVIKLAAQHDATNLIIHEPSLEEIFLRFYEPEQTPAMVK